MNFIDTKVITQKKIRLKHLIEDLIEQGYIDVNKKFGNKNLKFYTNPIPNHTKVKDSRKASTSKNVNHTHDTTVGNIYLSQHEESDTHRDTILKQIPNPSTMFSKILYYNDIKWISDCDISPTYDSMIGHVEEVPNEPKISFVAPIPTDCCKESFTDDLSST